MQIKNSRFARNLAYFALQKDEKGQSLMEVVVVIAVMVVVAGALTFATIASLRNANFSKNQTQATKLAQEGLETVRAARDRGDATINFASALTSWDDSDLWSMSITASQFCGEIAPCFFKLSGINLQWAGNGPNFNFSFAEPIQDGLFRRAIILSDDGIDTSQKIITAVVKWVDFAGEHESRLTTILRRP